MSFHKPEFHETKSERKFYEGRKQESLRFIDRAIKDYNDLAFEIKNLKHIPTGHYQLEELEKFKSRLQNIRSLVNTI